MGPFVESGESIWFGLDPDKHPDHECAIIPAEMVQKTLFYVTRDEEIKGEG